MRVPWPCILATGTATVSAERATARHHPPSDGDARLVPSGHGLLGVLPCLYDTTRTEWMGPRTETGDRDWRLRLGTEAEAESSSIVVVRRLWAA